jgi:predicted nuclease of predicted toxin-antitoxin system
VKVAFYMDVHVHSAITEGLRSQGVDVITAQEDDAAELDDPPLLDRSTELGRILFTQDQDFLREGAERQRSGAPFAGIIFAAQSSAMIGPYIRDLALIALASEAEEYSNRVIHLPL